MDRSVMFCPRGAALRPGLVPFACLAVLPAPPGPRRLSLSCLWGRPAARGPRPPQAADRSLQCPSLSPARQGKRLPGDPSARLPLSPTDGRRDSDLGRLVSGRPRGSARPDGPRRRPRELSLLRRPYGSARGGRAAPSRSQVGPAAGDRGSRSPARRQEEGEEDAGRDRARHDSRRRTLLPAASLLQLNGVRDACCKFLLSQLDPSNCLGIRGFADTHSCGDLLKAAHRYVLQHFVDVAKTEEFMLLPLKQVLELVSSDSLNVPSEEDVYRAVLSWVKHDVDARRQHVPRLMKCVRLPLLSRDFLLGHVDAEGLVRHHPDCKDLLIEALKFHLLPEQRGVLGTSRTRPRRCEGAGPVLFAVAQGDPELCCPQDFPGPESQQENLEQPFLSVFKKGRRRVPVRNLGKVVYYAKVQLRFQHSQDVSDCYLELFPAHLYFQAHGAEGLTFQGLLPLVELSVCPLEGPGEHCFQISALPCTRTSRSLPEASATPAPSRALAPTPDQEDPGCASIGRQRAELRRGGSHRSPRGKAPGPPLHLDLTKLTLDAGPEAPAGPPVTPRSPLYADPYTPPATSHHKVTDVRGLDEFLVAMQKALGPEPPSPCSAVPVSVPVSDPSSRRLEKGAPQSRACQWHQGSVKGQGPPPPDSPRLVCPAREGSARALQLPPDGRSSISIDSLWGKAPSPPHQRWPRLRAPEAGGGLVQWI
ncbi:PREDICTED: pleckstrin homology domain-containing family N member 1 [Condylura cristata]|uniref:pleckstrin homology domain-containing family N member 1 n=1 Tax=Condylura cristata TaxID=143302 RepID=UPI000642DFF9|nr:PREDICTED: pleckstrin homology domain-containing family N member 1 [Condylura cristata]